METSKLLIGILALVMLISCGDSSMSYEDYRDKATRLKAEVAHLKMINSSVSDSIDALEAIGDKSDRLKYLKAEYSKRNELVNKKENEFFELLAKCDRVYWWRARLYVTDRNKGH